MGSGFTLLGLTTKQMFEQFVIAFMGVVGPVFIFCGFIFNWYSRSIPKNRRPKYRDTISSMLVVITALALVWTIIGFFFRNPLKGYISHEYAFLSFFTCLMIGISFLLISIVAKWLDMPEPEDSKDSGSWFIDFIGMLGDIFGCGPESRKLELMEKEKKEKNEKKEKKEN
jgi:magnesium-transporting ATPase (P-type)